jgi:hypothetical protein
LAVSFDYVRIKKPCEVAIARPKEEAKTVIVLGSGRGGTSCVAGAVHLLGVRMVETGLEVNSEDSEIVNAFQSPSNKGYISSLKSIRRVINRRNSQHKVWGWKDPSYDLYLDGIISSCRNPHFLFVFRSIFDVALSHVAANSISIEDAIGSALRRYSRNWELVQKFGCPTLMVGYEKALQDKEGFVSGVCDFLGLHPTAPQRRKAISFLREDGGYRTVSGGRRVRKG